MVLRTWQSAHKIWPQKAPVRCLLHGCLDYPSVGDLCLGSPSACALGRSDSPLAAAVHLADSPFVSAARLLDSPFVSAVRLSDSPFVSAARLSDSPFVGAIHRS